MREEGSVEWKKKSCVTAGKTWLIIVSFSFFRSARSPFGSSLLLPWRAREREMAGGRWKKDPPVNRLLPLSSSLSRRARARKRKETEGKEEVTATDPRRERIRVCGMEEEIVCNRW